jgi:predicted transcriptional regulator
MGVFVHARLIELETLLSAAKERVERINCLDSIGGRDAFEMVSENACLHDFIKRALAEADKLSKHFSSQMKRQAK